MTRRLHSDPKVSTRGTGNYGVRLTNFVLSGAPGGYTAVEIVHLFPTLEEREDHARELRRRWRGSRKYGPVIETFEVEVAEVGWFDQMYRRTVLMADHAENRYGMVRIYDTTPPTYDVRYAESEEELRRMLAAQWEDNSAEPASGEPRAPYDVGFFIADEPLRLHMVIEVDEEEDEPGVAE